MCQVHKPEGWVIVQASKVKWKCEHKVNTQSLILFIHNIEKLFVFFRNKTFYSLHVEDQGVQVELEQKIQVKVI